MMTHSLVCGENSQQLLDKMTSELGKISSWLDINKLLLVLFSNDRGKIKFRHIMRILALNAKFLGG